MSPNHIPDAEPFEVAELNEGASLPLRNAAAQATAMAGLREPNFLHPTSIGFDIISHIRSLLVPAIVAVYSAARGGVWGLGFATLIFGGALVRTLVRYFTLRYCIKGSDFVVTEGLLFRRIRSVPIRRIQNVDLVQNVLHRLLGVAEVRIETASGTEPEATLRVLTHAQIEELRHAIFGGEAEPEVGTNPSSNFVGTNALATAALATSSVVSSQELSGVAAESPAAASSRRLIHHIPVRRLIAAGLASNRGAVLFGILFGLYFQSGFDSEDTAKRLTNKGWWSDLIRPLQPYLPSTDTLAGVVGLVALGLLVVFFCLRIVGIAWYILRFYDHQLTRHGNDLRISCGLFTKVSATIPRQRIQFISVHRTLFMRWMKLAAIRIETAGGSGGENENAASTVSRRWFLPVVAESDIARLLGELRPGNAWDESQFVWHAVSPLTARRLMRVSFLVSALLSAVGIWLWFPWGAAGGLVTLPLLSYLAIKKSRAMRYARTDWGVAYRSGLLTRKLSFAFYDRMQTISFNQTPFDRRWNMAAISVDTAAAGPADHLIDVPYLDAAFAAEQFRELQSLAARHRPSWG